MKLPFIKSDDRQKRMISKREKIAELETMRDQMLDHGFPKRAQVLENRIRSLKREVDNISRG